MKYSSTKDTLKHIKRIRELLKLIIKEIIFRGERHDNSKLISPEKEVFDKYTPKLKNSTYGSDEYKSFLKGMGKGLKHHYENNRHHPEYWKNGINDMDLVDIIEMLMDWKAASERHNDGDIMKSLEIQKDRFNISPQLIKIMKNTILNFNL